MVKDKYINGLEMEQFTHLPEISHYNSNYYKGFEKDLLYGKSDDDNTTEWWLIVGSSEPKYIGESYYNENEMLHVFDKQQT